MRGNTTKSEEHQEICLLAALFNALPMMNGYYQAEVNHDMPELQDRKNMFILNFLLENIITAGMILFVSDWRAR